MNPPVDPLDELLNRCAPTPEPPAQLVEKIRERLTTLSDVTARASWLTRIDIAVARPSFAAAFIAACALLGLFLAESRLSRWHAARGAELARSYVQLIDPLLKSNLPPLPEAPRSP